MQYRSKSVRFRFYTINLRCLLSLLLMEVSLASNDYEHCIMQALDNASDNVTVAELKTACIAFTPSKQPKTDFNEADSTKDEHLAAKDELLVEKRLEDEYQLYNNPYVLTGHKPNYFIVGYYQNAPDPTLFREQYADNDIEFSKISLKSQISAKFLIAEELFGKHGNLYVGYTNRSFWQAFNHDISSPFREIDHEPEAWLSFRTGYEFLGFRSSLINLGFVHQSNGNSGILSRSWNRIYATFVMQKNDFVFAIKPWYRVNEDEANDDNPDIEDYMGNFEFHGIYRKNDQNFGIMFRNNLQSEKNRGALQLDWTFPLHRNFKGYVQWFNGYGESLIDYNHNVNTIGIGIKFTDWL